MAITAWSKMKLNSCGLDGEVRIFTHPDVERRTCWGSLTDWNQQRCGSEARLKLQLNGRCAATDAGRHFTDEHATLTARPGFLQQGMKADRKITLYRTYFFHGHAIGIE